MFTQPPDLSNEAVVDVLLSGWGIGVDQIAYSAVGFGSHHWHVRSGEARWFVTVDDLSTRLRDGTDTLSAARLRLESALTTANRLETSGMSFVVGPLISGTKSVLVSIDERYQAAVYPHVDGVHGDWGAYGTQGERLDVVDRLIELHDSTELVHDVARTDEFIIPNRDHLETALADTASPDAALADTSLANLSLADLSLVDTALTDSSSVGGASGDGGSAWNTGPYGEPARELFARHGAALADALGEYDDLVQIVRTSDARPVVTHGEPHRGNVIFTAEGPVLVDWDTVLLAPVERDLWSLIAEDPIVATYYSEQSGRSVNADAVAMYRLWWDLCEVSLYVDEFRHSHVDSADTRTAWRGLTTYLDPARWTSTTS